MRDRHYTVVLFVIIVAIIVIFFKVQTITNIHKFVSCESLNDTSLFDIIHQSLPNITELYWVGDVLLTILVVFAVYIISNSNIDIYLVVLMFLVMFLIKCITTTVTILPDPSGICTNKYGGNKTLKAIFGTCNELMFSGHTGVAFLLLFILQKHVNWFLFVILSLYVAILCYITVVTRNHYSIDVIVSFFVSYFVFHSLK